MTEPLDVMRKRLHMRSIRRGIKEMDLILMAFSKAELAGLDEAQLNTYDALLSENDHDLYQWVSGQVGEPETYRELMDLIRVGAVGLTKP
ncbi:MAG: succinate dehydrogenase assembly factor 2 [Octadecabacter sp.]|jgi:antitoxin CptB|nr:succinate dehydrogenase assembly factor 2 [Octadecabacter sp.]MDC1231295.1 succinate dehydrogenase assembly factor 2 [Octadecabacter sp.]MDC1297428.1 succinate dehydrogenase assembly factor 2 [Octadecabacter sp.]MDG1408404.1 succinate dehydrogenase assembly factor 2 [Octadecabacter sp.]|tara:strand:+ start:1655 stop:1924 length:270 start_codon:yes stop_codon:yes gene_type:complete